VNIPLGPHQIKVLSGTQVTFDLAREGKFGDSNLERLTIRVRDDVPETIWRETLIHELLHHILGLTEYAERWTDEYAEGFIRAVSPYLAQSGAFSKVLKPRKGV